MTVTASGGNMTTSGDVDKFQTSFWTSSIETGSAPAVDDVNPELLLDKAEHICERFVIPTVCIFGIIGNAINVSILTRRNMRGSPYTYLLGLAVTDISVLTLSLIESTVSKTLGQGVFAWKVFDGFIFFPVANVFSNSSVWITVLLTVERYVSVRFPLKAKELCTRRLARRTIVAIVLISLLINIPKFFCSRVARNANGIYEKMSTAFEAGSTYRTLTWIYISLIHFIPCLMLMYLNAGLIRIVYSANRRRSVLRAGVGRCTSGSSAGSRTGLRSDSNPSVHGGHRNCASAPGAGGAGGGGGASIYRHYSTEQMRMTITCISIICLFLVCIVPSAFSNRPVAYALFGRNQTMNEFMNGSSYRLLRVITNLLVYCNLSLNFVLYCVFNQKFLLTLRFLSHSYLCSFLRVASSKKTIGNRFRRLSNSTSGCGGIGGGIVAYGQITAATSSQCAAIPVPTCKILRRDESQLNAPARTPSDPVTAAVGGGVSSGLNDSLRCRFYDHRCFDCDNGGGITSGRQRRRLQFRLQEITEA